MSRRSGLRDPLEDVLIEEGRLPAPRRSFRLEDIGRGWRVVDNRDDEVGTVEDVREGYVSVHRGFLSPRLYVPVSAIGEVREGVVALNVPATWIRDMGWTRPPRDAGTPTHGSG